jgi:ribosomal protein S18 acetylase RimI-like enzyme
VGSVIGGWDGRRGWIYHLAVEPEHQRQGIGAGLVREVEKRLVAKGAKKVNAQVYKWNERSSQFFKAIGYETQPDLIMIGKQLRK